MARLLLSLEAQRGLLEEGSQGHQDPNIPVNRCGPGASASLPLPRPPASEAWSHFSSPAFHLSPGGANPTSTAPLPPQSSLPPSLAHLTETAAPPGIRPHHHMPPLSQQVCPPPSIPPRPPPTLAPTWMQPSPLYALGCGSPFLPCELPQRQECKSHGHTALTAPPSSPFQQTLLKI